MLSDQHIINFASVQIDTSSHCGCLYMEIQELTLLNFIAR